MLFNSFTFIGLMLVTSCLYYQKWFATYQIQLLIASSFVFYAYNNPILLLLLLFSAGINVVSSYYVSFGNPKGHRIIATLGVVFNLSLLAFFKYSPLIAQTLFQPNDSMGHFLASIPLPIGISFYTFEGISLLVDVFNEKDAPAKQLVVKLLREHIYRTLFFISFFPHLVAGPILKAHDFFPQIETKYFKHIQWERCFKHLVIGYFLKMVVADNLKDFTMWIAFPYFQAHSAITLGMMLFGYSCQIFADFAGYSLIAIGLAHVFGYNLLQNFNFPYISSSFQEFWKRWHISLSSFLMEYLYFPLGGNRKGKARTYFNLLMTMFLGGLWHGAAWSYAIWGLFHGGALAIERFLKDKWQFKASKTLIFFKQIMVFSFVTLAWLFFKLPIFEHVVAYVQTIFAHATLAFDIGICYHILLYSLPVWMYHFLYVFKNDSIGQLVLKYEYVCYGIMLFLIVTNSGTSGSFIYFQF